LGQHKLAWISLLAVGLSAGSAAAQGPPVGTAQTAAPVPTREQFLASYRAWFRNVTNFGNRSDINLGWMHEVPEYRAMVDMGIGILPYAIEQVREDRRALVLWDLIHDLTHTEYNQVFPPFKSGLSNEQQGERARQALLQWWEGGAARAKQQFDGAIAEWDRLRDTKSGRTILFSTDSMLYYEGFVTTLAPKETPAGKAYRELYELGAPVLPYLVERIETGDVQLVPAFQKITAGKFAPPDWQTREERIAGVKQWWEANRAHWLVPWPEKTDKAPK